MNGPQKAAIMIVHEGTPPEHVANGNGMPWALLNTAHPEYKPTLSERLDLLHRGGYDILERADLFVPKIPGEANERYQYRLKHTAYIGHFPQVVGYIVGSLFAQPIQVHPASDADDKSTPGEVPDANFYETFGRDADRQQTSFSDFMAARLTTALVHKRCPIGLDMPPAPAAVNRLQEERAGGGAAYLFDIPVDSLINWELDAEGHMVGAVLKTRLYCAQTAWGGKPMNRFRFKVWRMRGPEGADPAEPAAASVVEFAIFETGDLEAGETIAEDTVIPMVTPWTPTTFAHVPIYLLELPAALWAGNKAGPLCEEHFRRRSDLCSALNRGLLEVPFVKHGPEIGAVHDAFPSEVQQSPARGLEAARSAEARGWVMLGHQDEIGFASPTGAAYEISEKSLDALRDEIFRTLHAMALSLANTHASVVRSGDSKREDRSATEIVLGALSRIVRDASQKIYQAVSLARAEQIVWTTSGLDHFSSEDKQEAVEEATIVQGLTIPSPTFQKIYLTKTALALVHQASPQEKKQIQDEIDKGVEENLEHAKVMREQEVNPDPELDPDEDEDGPHMKPGGHPKPGAES